MQKVRHNLVLSWNKAEELIQSHTREYVSNEMVVDPLVSVSLTTFQHATYIRDALQSILFQKTTFPYEVVIGEDGSNDGTFEYVRDMHYKHPDKIRILHSVPNLGVYTRSGMLSLLRNLAACRGKYIAFLEGDDFWDDQSKLQRQVDLMEVSPNASGSWHDVKIIGNSPRQDMYLDMSNARNFRFEDQLGGKCACATASLLLRRDLLPNKWEKWQIYAPWFDQFLIAHYSLHGEMVKVEGKMGVYRTHEGGVTQSEFWRSWEMARRLVDYSNGMRKWCGSRGDRYYKELGERYFELLFTRGLKTPSFRSLNAVYSGALTIGFSNAMIIAFRKVLSRVCQSKPNNQFPIR